MRTFVALIGIALLAVATTFGVTETCAKPSAAGSAWTYSNCVTVTASPSAPPSPATSPTP